jgi:hypothetical protein
LKLFGHKRIPPWWLPPDYAGDWPSIQGLIEERLENKQITYNIDPIDLYVYLRQHQYPEKLGMPPDAQQENEEAELSYFESQHLMNNTSVVLKVSYENKTLVFPGDLTNWTYVLTKRAKDIQRITVFKAPHAGYAALSLAFHLVQSRPEQCGQPEHLSLNGVG